MRCTRAKPLYRGLFLNDGLYIQKITNDTTHLDVTTVVPIMFFSDFKEILKYNIKVILKDSILRDLDDSLIRQLNICGDD